MTVQRQLGLRCVDEKRTYMMHVQHESLSLSLYIYICIYIYNTLAALLLLLQTPFVEIINPESGGIQAGNGEPGFGVAWCTTGTAADSHLHPLVQRHRDKETRTGRTTGLCLRWSSARSSFPVFFKSRSSPLMCSFYFRIMDNNHSCRTSDVSGG